MMKIIKPVLAAVLAALLMLSLCMTAFAEEKGSITVTNPVKDQTYKIYRIFDLESYDNSGETKLYSYKLRKTGLSEDFINFLKGTDINGTYITVDTNEYVTWLGEANAQSFAKAVLEKATELNITPDAVLTANSADALVFENLPLGYYLIDSSVGVLCALTTNDPNATVNEKNELTTIEKYVKEDTTSNYGKENSAKIGDTISFRSEVTLGAGTHNLVVHDAMNSYLALKPETVKVYILQSEVATENYELTYEYVDETKLVHSLKDNCTFEIRFKDSFISTLAKGTVIRIEYDAVLENCEKEWKSFDNDTWVKFGDNLVSTTSTTTTHTYSLEMVKTNEKNVVIQTAKFYLYDSPTGGNIIPLILTSEDTECGIYRYRVATPADKVVGNGDEIKAGFAYIYGLDNIVYYLEETEQPTGFNKLSERYEVDMTAGDIKIDQSGNFYHDGGKVLGSVATDRGGVQVINKSGTVLPSTGGIGTTLFYVLGGVLVTLAGVMLITKKRMGRKTY